MSVVSLKQWVNGSRPNYDLYVGRAYRDLKGSKWANPFSKYRYPNEASYKMFIEHFWSTPDLYLNIDELTGKTLACWCSDDELCHARYLCHLANGTAENVEYNCNRLDILNKILPKKETKCRELFPHDLDNNQDKEDTIVNIMPDVNNDQENN